MSSTKIIRVLWLCLSIVVLKFDFGLSSLSTGTPVATSSGLVPIEKLKAGDKVLSYDFNETNPSKAIIEVAITKVNKHLTDSVFTMYTAENSFIEASPQQLFFVLKITPHQPDNVLVMDFVQAQHITTNHMLIDEHLNCIPIDKVTKLELSGIYPNQYVEKITRGRDGKITSIERRIVNLDVYSVEVEEPYSLLIADKPYYKKKGDPRLLIIHNGIPAIGAGLSLVFGSTPGSISFVQASVSAGGLGVIFGSTGLAFGAATGLGILGYQFFKRKKNKKTSFYIERAGSGSPGGYDPKDPKDPKDKKEKKSNDKSQNNIKIREDKANHIFRDKEGHFKQDTRNNRVFIEKIANNKSNYLGKSERGGCDWYGKITKDGKQIWVEVRNGEIRNAGINSVPKTWNSISGLKRLIHK